MSRIGKKPITVPEKVEVTAHGNIITAKGPKGTLSFTYTLDIAVEVKEGIVTVIRKGNSLKAKAIWGTTAKLIKNLFDGVTVGFEKKMELNGVGFRMNVAGRKLNLALGFSHPVEVLLPEGIEAKVEASILTITGIDKQRVGQFTAEVRKLKPVEPYKGKGFRFVGEIVRKKEGKKAAAA